MDIAAIEKLPCEAISCEPIRRAAAAFSAAKSAANDARKTHVQLTQELPNAHQEDARADELARAEGKPKLKGRPATQAAEKAIEDAEHEQRVSVLAAQRAKRELAAALDEHGHAWAAEVAEATKAITGRLADQRRRAGRPVRPPERGSVSRPRGRRRRSGNGRRALQSPSN